MEILLSKIRELYGRWKPCLALAAGCLVVAFLALVWHEHNARLKQAGRDEVLAKENAEEVKSLKLNVEDLETAARRAAVQAQQLEAQRDALERAAVLLRQRMIELQKAGETQVERIATLPAPEVAKEVGQALGPEGEAKEGAPPLLDLSEIGVRNVATALAELDSCKVQTLTTAQLLDNCERRNKLAEEAIAKVKSEVGSYQSALRAQQDITGKQKAEFDREFKAAKGSWLSRLGRNAKWFAVGAAAGAVVMGVTR